MLRATFFDGLFKTAQPVSNITGSLRPLQIVHARAEARGAAFLALQRLHKYSDQVDVARGTRAGPTGRPDAGAARAAHRGGSDDGRARRERRYQRYHQVDVKNAGAPKHFK